MYVQLYGQIQYCLSLAGSSFLGKFNSSESSFMESVIIKNFVTLKMLLVYIEFLFGCRLKCYHLKMPYSVMMGQVKPSC